MTTVRRMTAATCALTLVVGSGLAGSSAAAPKPVSPAAKRATIKQMNTWNTSWKRLASTVRTCRPASYRSAVALRGRALRNIRAVRTRPALTRRVTLMKRSVLTLSLARRACVRYGAPGAVLVVVSPGTGGGSNGAGSGSGGGVTPGPGGGGGGGGGGTTTPGVPGLVTSLADITIGQVLGGAQLKLTNLLGGLPLPTGLVPVALSKLEEPVCVAANTVCVGIDGTALLGAVNSTLGLNTVLANLLGINVNGLLAQVTNAVNTGDLTTILSVVRVNADTIRVVPVGALAQLTQLGIIPSSVIGRIGVTRPV